MMEVGRESTGPDRSSQLLYPAPSLSFTKAFSNVIIKVRISFLLGGVR